MTSTDRPENWSGDSVAATSVQVMGSGPAMAIATQYLSMAQASGLAALNAVAAQQNQYMQQGASLAREIIAILPVERKSESTDQSGLTGAILQLAAAVKND